jgi:periplasmic protein TonB
MSQQEKRNNRIGIITSLGIHAVLFLMLFFLVAWTAPNPPLAEFGVELNFGLDDQGSGEIQPENPVGDPVEENKEQTQEKSAETQPEEVKPDVKEEVKVPVEDKSTEKIVSKTESDVTVKEEKKEVKPEVVKEKPKDANPKEKIVAEYKKEEKKEVNPTDGAKKGEKGSQGDDTKKSGDKGSPEGTLDAKALYGTPGGGGGGNGLSLVMGGWAWADQPKIPDLPDNENGKVIFEIECDENGEIVGINTKERSLSPKAEQILKDLIRKNSLVRTSGGQVPSRSKGTIVFVLKTK